MTRPGAFRVPQASEERPSGSFVFATLRRARVGSAPHQPAEGSPPVDEPAAGIAGGAERPGRQRGGRRIRARMSRRSTRSSATRARKHSGAQLVAACWASALLRQPERPTESWAGGLRQQRQVAASSSGAAVVAERVGIVHRRPPIGGTAARAPPGAGFARPQRRVTRVPEQGGSRRQAAAGVRARGQRGSVRCRHGCGGGEIPVSSGRGTPLFPALAG